MCVYEDTRHQRYYSENTYKCACICSTFSRTNVSRNRLKFLKDSAFIFFFMEPLDLELKSSAETFFCSLEWNRILSKVVFLEEGVLAESLADLITYLKVEIKKGHLWACMVFEFWRK
ncbi:hypothetical protein CEXT_96581 [Caerostris extrusa]|uniref:Uncharacterized protein n=1 Tax=Caerostris extrusa TaxID=172846 RepID=A0AAV4SSE9_CAEEX|nr:hypothetical protein CEXT_96581 [Caerostris extrusa]